jgi:hypothetical protein
MNVTDNMTLGPLVAAKSQDVHLHYRVYGQRLCSGLPLPELPHADFQVRDLAVRCLVPSNNGGGDHGPARLLDRRGTSEGDQLSVWATEEGYLLRWEGKGDFHIGKDGRSVSCDVNSELGRGWLTANLYGLVLAFALHLKGVRNLHASAVVLPSGAVGFLAAPGSGKSTLAAAFAARGYPFLTDDLLAMTEEAPGYCVHPGFPFTSLSALSIGALGPSVSSVSTEFKEAPALPLGGKTRVAVDAKWAAFHPRPAPLSALFILRRGGPEEPIALECLPRAEAIRLLLENTICLPILPAQVLQAQLAFMAKLTASVPVWTLSYPTGFQHTPRIIEQVLAQSGSAL